MADDDMRDQRDGRIGALLEVESLDDVTRSRLVGTALRETAPSRSRRWLVAAAVLGVVVMGGTIALLATTESGSGDKTTAAPPLTPVEKGAPAAAPAASPAEPPATAAGPATPAVPPNGTPAAQPESAPPTAAPRKSGAPSFSTSSLLDAGDFGDLTHAANLQRLRATLESAGATIGTNGRALQLEAELATRTCAAHLPTGTVVALATGHFGTRTAIVVAIDLTNGGRSIDAVLTHPCKIRTL